MSEIQEPELKPTEPQNNGQSVEIFPTWAKVILGISVFLLIGLLLVLLNPAPYKSEKNLIKLQEKQHASIQEALSKNPEPFDYSGKVSPEINLTIDASVENKWAHLNFASGNVVYREEISRNTLDWDLALSRAKIVTNGGATNPDGKGGAIGVNTSNFDLVESLPDSEFMLDERTENIKEFKNPFLNDWYAYNFWNHKLTPKNMVYVVRTADGKYAKIQILNFYCGEASACYSIKYVYDGTGIGTFKKPK